MHDEIVELYIKQFIPSYVNADGKLVVPKLRPKVIDKCEVTPFPIFNVNFNGGRILYCEDPKNDVSVGMYVIFYQM